MKTYSIRITDKLNYSIVENGVVKDKKSKNFGKTTEKVIGFYPKLEQAAIALLELEIKTSNKAEIKDLLKAIKKAKKKVIKEVQQIETNNDKEG